MDPVTATIITGAISVLLIVITIINFIRVGMNMTNGMSDMVQSPSEDTIDTMGDLFGGTAKGIGLHFLFGGLASISSLLFIACLIWLAVTKLP